MEEYGKQIIERELEQTMSDKAESYSDFINTGGNEAVWGESPCEVCPDYPWCEKKEDDQ